MDKRLLAKVLLISVALIAISTAGAHLSCIYLGESCFRAQLAPPSIIQSAIDGTPFAIWATVLVSSLFVLVAVYALSAAKLLPQMPLMTLAIYSISILCLIRGAATLPLSIAFPKSVTTFTTTAGIIWFLSGLFLVVGFRIINKSAPR